MRRLIWLLPCAFLSLPAFAGERYTYKIESTGGWEDIASTRQILVDGSRYRMEPGQEQDEGLGMVLISRDGGENVIALLPEGRTYHNLKKPAPSPSGTLFGLLPGRSERSVTGVELVASAQPELEQVSGLATRRHDLRLSYDITVKLHSETVRGKVRMEASFWMAEDHSTPQMPVCRPEILTGFPEVDARLATALAKLRGLQVKRRMVISAEGDQGMPPRSTTDTMTILDIKKVETPSALFEVPRGFRYEEPVFVGPGGPR